MKSWHAGSAVSHGIISLTFNAYFLMQKDQGQVLFYLSVAASVCPIVKSLPLASVWAKGLFNNVPLALDSSWAPSVK